MTVVLIGHSIVAMFCARVQYHCATRNIPQPVCNAFILVSCQCFEKTVFNGYPCLAYVYLLQVYVVGKGVGLGQEWC